MLKFLAFAFSLSLFLLYLHCERKKLKLIKIEKEKTTQETLTITKTINTDFYTERFRTLYAMLEDVIEEERRGEEKVKRIKELNKYGVVVNDKNVEKANRELYSARRKKLQIQNQIMSTAKAQARG